MKKLIVLLFLFVTTSGYCQIIYLPDDQLLDLLCKSWNLKYGLLDGNNIGGLENISDMYEFKRDNTYTINSAGSSYSIGTWKYNVEQKRVELYKEEGFSSGYITILDNKELILIPGRDNADPNHTVELFFEASNQ